MNDGKKIERFVALIQETIKNLPNTIVFQNYLIENTDHRKREFDVFIKSTINNLAINIAIECKDYKSAVPVEKLEAFNSKCLRVKGISKKVFVSTNGYQADCYGAAKEFDIDLYHLSDLSKETISKWFPIVQLKTNIKLHTPFKLTIVGKKEDKKNVPKETNLILHFYENIESIPLSAYVWNHTVVPKQKEIQSVMLFDFMKRKNKEECEIITRIPFKLEMTGVYIVGLNGEKVRLSQINSEIVGWFSEQPANIIEARTFGKDEMENEASIVSIGFGKDEKADIVFGDDENIKIFHTREDGMIFKLEDLWTYDPKTDEFKPSTDGKNKG